MRDGSKPAFPGQWRNDGDINCGSPDGQIVPPGGVAHMTGVTLRQWYAGMALQGIEASQGNGNHFISTEEKIAARAFALADAMLAEGAK